MATVDLLNLDRKRNHKLPPYQKYFRRCQKYKKKSPLWLINYAILKFWSVLYCVEIHPDIHIDGGMYIGHPYGITINPEVRIGKNLNIHKGVTIGRENRGKRMGVPVIGNSVWIGVNSTIVGAITIGDDVLIAPNTYLNSDVPSHSIVFGNPCTIKPRPNATLGYINNPV